MPLVTSVQAAAVEVFWKYRLESIQSIRLGTKLTKPNMDSDAILEGIQNEGLVDVKFLPAAERIDLYYRSLNEAGRGPVVNIVPTTDLFLLNNSIEKRTTDLFMRGASVLTLRAGMILRVEDEMVIVEGHVLLNRTQLYERITAFWYLNEDGGDRVNISANNALKDFTENLVTSQDGPQSGTKAAYFTGSIAEPQALSVKYDARLSLGDTDNNDGFTFSCWVRLQDNTVDRAVISRLGSVDGGRREFQLQYNSSQNRFEALMIKSDFGVETVHTLTHSAGIFTNTWYFLCCWFDPTARRLYLFINNSTENIVIPVAGAIPHVSIPTTVGAQLVEESADTANLMISNPWNGRIANVGFWKRVLTGTERASLFRDYTLDSIPAAHVILEDRGAHGTEAVAHDVDAVITRMFPTVPHNSIVMDALADKSNPDAPESFICAPSGDDAEIGVEVIIAPPTNNRKTINRIQIQAKTAPIFPATIEWTTGSKRILSGPHIGEVRQGESELITSANLAGVASPYHLYTYEAINVNTGVIVAPFAYSIESVEQVVGTTDWRIRIRESFTISRGIFGNSRSLTFLVVRGWFDAPRDLVINDPPLVTPPAGDSYAHIPFQKFYKTTKNIYLRARYINRYGAGPWIYWDGVNGSVDITRARLFSPAGLQIPTVTDGLDGLDGASVEFVYILHDSADSTTFPVIPPTAPEDRNRDDFIPDDWSDGAPQRTPNEPLVLFATRKRPRGFGAWGEFEPPRLLTGEKGRPGENALSNLDVIAIVRWWRLTATSSPPIIPEITNNDDLQNLEYPPQSVEDPPRPTDWTRLTNDADGPYDHFTTAALPYLWECYRYHIELKGGEGSYAQQFRGPFLITSDPSLFGGETPSNDPTAALTANVSSLVSPGGAVTLFWTTTNAVSARIEPGGIDIPLGMLAMGNISRNIAATTTFILTVIGAAGTDDAVDFVTVIVTDLPLVPPVIDSFDSDDSTIELGESTTLRWRTTGANSVTLNGATVNADDSMVVAPIVDTDYILEATNDDGDATRTIRVIVAVCDTPLPTIDAFTADPLSIESGETSTLTWITTGATEVEIDQGVGAVNVDGDEDVSPSSTKIYKLTATNECGSRTRNVTVTVTMPDPPPIIRTFSATPSTIVAGGSSNLKWTTDNAAIVSINHGVGNQSADGNVDVEPTVTTTYTLTAYESIDEDGDGTGRSVTSTEEVTVNPVEPDEVIIDTFSATPSTINAGETTTLSWMTSNAAAVRINSGTFPVDGTLDRTLTASRMYHLVAYEFDTDPPSGRTARKSILVTVNQPPAPIVDSFAISPSSHTITRGDSITLTWETTNADTVTLHAGGTIDTISEDGSATRSPTVTTTYFIRATNLSGSDDSSSITIIVVAPLPVINTFSVSPDSADIGLSVTITLSWTTTDATSCIINEGVGSVPVDGSTTQIVGDDTTWTLRAINADGNEVSRSISIEFV